MTDDPRFPHLAKGYAAQPADMAARPQNINAPTHPMTTGTTAPVSVTTSTEPPQGEAPDDGGSGTMRSGRALEEMNMSELRARAAARGIKAGSLKKAALIAKLRK